MIFKQGYITASIDKFLHALGEQPENVKGYGNAARQGSEDMESILTVPIAIVRTFEYQNLQYQHGPFGGWRTRGERREGLI